MDQLILANPGTGKTTALSRRTIELLEAGIDASDILCVTFTEKAASEMRHKIAELASEKGILQKAQDLNIHTFHSYALSYLEEMGESYEVLGNNAIRYSVFKSFTANGAFNYSKEYVISEIVPKVENAIRYLKSYGIMPEQIRPEGLRPHMQKIFADERISNITIEEQFAFAEYFLKAFSDYEMSKPAGSIDYNDMLLRFVQLKEKRKFGHVLVDELQDVNELEAQIAIESGGELFLVGDRKQAIFGFQGGSVRNFQIIEEKLKPKRETLVKNYRSLGEILRYASAHFESNTSYKGHADELSGFAPVREGAGSVRIMATAPGSQERLAVKTALESYGLGGKTAIITRTNGQLLRLSKLLDSKGIRYSTTISNATSDYAKSEIIAFLNGLLRDDEERIANALFTPFSGVSLKEAFGISRMHAERRLGNKNLEEKAPSFMRMRKDAFSITALEGIFERFVIPISISIGKDFYITALALLKSIKEFFSEVSAPQIQDLFDYLSIIEESYEPIGGQERLVLTTVHKAKGLEFDNVIYVPKETHERMSFVDVVVYAAIMAAKGIDIREELDEERLRVDFVAFTRARDSLTLVVDTKSRQYYEIGGYRAEDIAEGDDEPEPLSHRYDEAYALFVNGRYKEAELRLGGRDDWLVRYIKAYFDNVSMLSYTLVESISDPFSFFKSYIAGIREESRALSLGNSIHSMAESMFTKKFEGPVGKAEEPYMDNVKAVNRSVTERYGAVQIAAEESLVLPLERIIGERNGISGLSFKAKMDAIYKTRDGYLILDYKTDKKADNASEHRRQLATYRRMYALAKGINEKDISVALGFVGLRGNINTGKPESLLDAVQPKSGQFETVKKHIEKFLEYREDPELFARALVEQATASPLHERLKAELSPAVT